MFYALSKLKIECDIDAVKEGEMVFPYQPLIRVKGPLLQAQLLETPLLNLINFPTLIATKASKLKEAVGTDLLVEFGVRRAQGPNGALFASRAAYLGGCDASSHVLAGKFFKIPLMGTMAHSWVMTHDTENHAFENYAQIMPAASSFLIDTYHTLEGAKKAIEVAKKLLKKGVHVQALRIDSGDLVDLSQKVRQMLDEQQLYFIKIMATNELDEHKIEDLKARGAKVDLWGVGTHLVTCKDQPALDGVYKLSYIEEKSGWGGVIKISDTAEKITDPGILQIRRYYKEKKAVFDVLVDESFQTHQIHEFVDRSHFEHDYTIESSLTYQDLLVPIMREGKIVYEFPPLTEIKNYHEVQKKNFPSSVISLSPHKEYLVGMERSLFDRRQQLLNRYRAV